MLWGTNTLYRNEAKIAKPSRIGFSQVANEEIIEKIVKGSTRVYDLTITELLEKNNILPTKIYVDGLKDLIPQAAIKLKNFVPRTTLTECC